MGRYKDDYELSPHRFRELKHFCMQYPEWVAAYRMLSGPAVGHEHDDITADVAIKMAEYAWAMELVETTARECGLLLSDLRHYSDVAVRRFYWLLSQRRGV